MVVMYYVALGLGLISQCFARTTGKVLKYPYEEWDDLHAVQDGQEGPTAMACGVKSGIIDTPSGRTGI